MPQRRETKTELLRTTLILSTENKCCYSNVSLILLENRKCSILQAMSVESEKDNICEHSLFLKYKKPWTYHLKYNDRCSGVAFVGTI